MLARIRREGRVEPIVQPAQVDSPPMLALIERLLGNVDRQRAGTGLSVCSLRGALVGYRAGAWSSTYDQGGQWSKQTNTRGASNTNVANIWP